MKSPENLTCKQLGLPIGLVLWTILFPSSVYTQDRTCTSPCYQCNFAFVCDPPPPAFCKRENIALGRQGSMSSLHIPQNSSEYNTNLAACLAFDGYRNTKYVFGLLEYKLFLSPNCIHTMNFSEEWLQVDLGKIYTVRNITVYRRSNGLDQEIDRLANILITVDNQQCYQFPENVTGFPVEIHVRCSSPLTGRIVKLSTHNQYLNLCEIEVWVCTSGLYGETCDGVCRCKNNATCDNYYGTCPTGCDAGYYGLNCSLQCGHCANMSQCNASGYCLSDCQNGWQGPRCDEADTSNERPIAIVVAPIIVGVALIVCAALIVYAARKYTRRTKGNNVNNSMIDMLPLSFNGDESTAEYVEINHYSLGDHDKDGSGNR